MKEYKRIKIIKEKNIQSTINEKTKKKIINQNNNKKY